MAETFETDPEVEAAARAIAPHAFNAWSKARREAMSAPGADPASAKAVADASHGRPVNLALAQAISSIDASAMRSALSDGRVGVASRRAMVDEVRSAARALGEIGDEHAETLAVEIDLLLSMLESEIPDMAPSQDGLAETAGSLAEDRLRLARRIGAWGEQRRSRWTGGAVIVGIKAIAMMVAAGNARD